jgi:hypothetical protein
MKRKKRSFIFLHISNGKYWYVESLHKWMHHDDIDKSLSYCSWQNFNTKYSAIKHAHILAKQGHTVIVEYYYYYKGKRMCTTIEYTYKP